MRAGRRVREVRSAAVSPVWTLGTGLLFLLIPRLAHAHGEQLVVIWFFALVLIKLPAYGLAGAWLRKRAGTGTAPLPFIALKGALALIGALAAWAVVSGLAFALKVDAGFASWYVGLLPFRVIVWFLALRICFESLGDRRTHLKYAALGVLWSYASDAIIFGAAALLGSAIMSAAS